MSRKPAQGFGRRHAAKRRPGGFTLVELLVVIVIIGLLAALLLPALAKALCSGKEGAMKHLIDQLTQACKQYELDNNAFPTGAGSPYPTAPLVAGLQAAGPKTLPYFEFQADTTTGAPAGGKQTGDIKSTIWPTSEILHYRNNSANYPTNLGDATAHNKTSVDIWSKDCNQSEFGVNNWE